MTPLHVEQIKRARTLSPELAEKVRSMRMRAAMYEAECYRTDRDHGPNSVAGEFPRAPIQRSRVYTGRGDAGTYNHHSQLAKFQGRYYAAWSNGRVNEDMPGQGTMLAVSDDASSWSVVGCIVPCDAESGMLRWTTGLYADARQMVLYGVVHHATLDAEAPGNGWKASTLDATRLPFFLLLPTAPLAIPLMNIRSMYRILWPLGQRALGIHEATVEAPMTQWHSYEIDWAAKEARFKVNGQEILRCASSPRGPLGFVMWLDNQYAIATPWGSFGHGLLETHGKQWMEVQSLSIRRG